MDLLIFTTIVVKITNPKSGLNLITNSSSPVLSAPSYFTGARRYPLSYVFSGFYGWGNGDLSRQDSDGNWWSITAVDNTSAYALRIPTQTIMPRDSNGKHAGFPLRCVSYSTNSPSVSAFVCILRRLLLGRW
ncbi:hypothetical protein IJH16_01765 [Candidatus Saccharibacteria bacterium]|nr:hypothetical protein [Candidatus Saccharibacteria bacterium]